MSGYLTSGSARLESTTTRFDSLVRVGQFSLVESMNEFTYCRSMGSLEREVPYVDRTTGSHSLLKVAAGILGVGDIEHIVP